MYLLLTPATAFNGKSKYIYVREGEDAKAQILKQIDTASIISRKGIFTMAANAMGIWKDITPGRFEIKPSP